jgi:hypothetical protein
MLFSELPLGRVYNDIIDKVMPLIQDSVVVNNFDALTRLEIRYYKADIIDIEFFCGKKGIHINPYNRSFSILHEVVGEDRKRYGAYIFIKENISQKIVWLAFRELIKHFKLVL